MKIKKQIINKIISLIRKGKKEKVVFLLGHLPLDYFNETISPTKWGNFTPTTLELGLEIAQKIRDEKDVSFLLLVDDKGTVEEIRNFNSTQMSRIRNKVYRNAEEYYQTIFREKIHEYGFSDENVILQTSEKANRNNLKLHSELLLFRDSSITNVCAGSYQQIVKMFAEDAILVSFIPMLCKENICMIAMSLLDLNPEYELINCFMEVGKKSEEEFLNTCILRSSLERREK